MSSFDEREIRYLLGTASDEETARFDELSITDDEFAERLRAAENDLVDSYVNGELMGETLERFKAFYLSSENRLEKVKFAESFLAVTNARSEGDRRFRPWWAWAAAAAVMMMISGYLVYENRLVEDRLDQAEAARSAAQRREHALQTQLEEARSAAAPVAIPEKTVVVAALVLFPQTRGAGSIATIALPVGAERVAFELMLESDEFSAYQVVLKDPPDGRILWRQGGLRKTNATLSVSVPAGQLKQQNYSLELSATAANGNLEMVGSYSFRILKR
jgi:hypothetical protein